MKILLIIAILFGTALCMNSLAGEKYTYAEDDFEHHALGLMKDLSALHYQMNTPGHNYRVSALYGTPAHVTAEGANDANQQGVLNTRFRAVKRYDARGNRRSKYDVELKIAHPAPVTVQELNPMNTDGSMSPAFLAAQQTRQKLKDFLKQYEIEPTLKINDDNPEKKHHFTDLSKTAIPQNYASHSLVIDPVPLAKKTKITDSLDLDDAETIKDQHGNQISVIPGTAELPLKPETKEKVIAEKAEEVEKKEDISVDDKKENEKEIAEENVQTEIASAKADSKEKAKEKTKQKEEAFKPAEGETPEPEPTE